MNEIFRLIGDGLDLIGNLVENHQDDAEKTLAAVKRVYGTMTGALAGRVTPERAQRELARLRATITSTNTDVDAALDAKFPKE